MSTAVEWLLILVILLEAGVVYWLLNRNLIMQNNCLHLEKDVKAGKQEVEKLEIENVSERVELEEEYNKNLKEVEKEAKKQKGRAQSAHTSKGYIVEKWCPFIDHPDIDEKWKSENWSYLGNPIDYIIWDWHHNKKDNLEDGKIIFIDVKSAKSQLTTKQRRIRDLINEGRIEWREIRLD